MNYTPVYELHPPEGTNYTTPECTNYTPNKEKLNKNINKNNIEQKYGEYKNVLLTDGEYKSTAFLTFESLITFSAHILIRGD